MSKTIRNHIIAHIYNNIGTRLGNIERGTASFADKELVGEALGFVSLCRYSAIDDKTLKNCWDKSNLEYAL